MIRKTIQVQLTSLKSNPLQGKYFAGTTSNSDDADLRKSLDEQGQRDAIVVVSLRGAKKQYMVLDGHRRVSQMQMLGWKHANVIVREDLRDATEAEVEAVFLSFNSVRRQLSPLARIRIAVGQAEIAAGRSWLKMGQSADYRLREQLAKSTGQGPRNITRYLSVLRTPPEIQNAVERGSLRLNYAAQIGCLPTARQQEIVTAIAFVNPRDTNKVVGGMLNPRGGKHVSAIDAVSAFSRVLDRSVADLAGRVDRISPRFAVRVAPSLRAGRTLIGEILRRIPGESETDTGS